jgi:hypothetical protein
LFGELPSECEVLRRWGANALLNLVGDLAVLMVITGTLVFDGWNFVCNLDF